MFFALNKCGYRWIKSKPLWACLFIQFNGNFTRLFSCISTDLDIISFFSFKKLYVFFIDGISLNDSTKFFWKWMKCNDGSIFIDVQPSFCVYFSGISLIRNDKLKALKLKMTWRLKMMMKMMKMILVADILSSTVEMNRVNQG